mmetsp:Transcript_13072/g.18072  ORF Transcript_13072/g.18072 Transcript_13072/m.18072 type:complete len:258 (-) Transcript_13072:197-970(-)
MRSLLPANCKRFFHTWQKLYLGYEQCHFLLHPHRLCSQYTTVFDNNSFLWLSFRRTNSFHGFHNFFVSFEDFAKDDMFSVKVRSWGNSQEKLRSIGMLPSVRHREQAFLLMLNFEVLVFKLLAVNGLASLTIPIGEVSSLAHESRNYSVERAAFVVEWLSFLSNSFLAGAQGPEVCNCLRNLFSVQSHHYPPLLLPSDGNIEEDFIRDSFICRHVLLRQEVLPVFMFVSLDNVEDETALSIDFIELPRALLIQTLGA